MLKQKPKNKPLFNNLGALVHTKVQSSALVETCSLSSIWKLLPSPPAQDWPRVAWGPAVGEGRVVWPSALPWPFLPATGASRLVRVRKNTSKMIPLVLQQKQWNKCLESHRTVNWNKHKVISELAYTWHHTQLNYPSLLQTILFNRY